MKTTVFEERSGGITISRVICDFEYNMASRHFHEEYEIYYLLEGERYYFIDHSTHLVRNGSLVFINKNQVHKTSPVAGSSYHDRIWIQLNSKQSDPVFTGSDFSLEEFFTEHCGVIRLDMDQQKYVEKLIYDMVREIREGQEGCRLMTGMRLMELLIYAARCLRQNDLYPVPAMLQTEKYLKVQEIADYISENYRNAGSLEEIAGRFFISKSYLSRIFKEVTGFTVNEYLNIRRIMKAKQLLSTPEPNVTAISEMLGYENVSYFERVFKKYAHTTPLRFRRQVLEDKKQLTERMGQSIITDKCEQ